MLIKEDETEEYVIYKFGPIDCSLGKIKIHKGSGETLEIEKAPNSTTKFYYYRAASKLMRIHKGNGIFSDKTSFAS